MNSGEKQRMMNAGYTNVNRAELLSMVASDVERHAGSRLIFLNVDVVMKIERDAYLQKIVEDASYTVADGMPLIWISRWLRRPLREKISGSDFVPALCKYAKKNKKTVFFAGGAPEVLEEARKNLMRKYAGIQIVGTYSPPLGFEDSQEEIQKMNETIKAARPDILIVCLGCPKQEKYIYENYKEYDAGISVCAGGTIDFLSGRIPRCPAWMSRHGLEWFFRFSREPKRLFKRYFIDDVQILRLIWKYRGQAKERQE